VLRGYLAGRANLMRVFVLVDARHGVKPVDQEIMALLDAAAVSFQVVLTKADKISEKALPHVEKDVHASLRKHPAAFPELISTSSEKGAGIDVLRATIARLMAESGG